MPTSKVNNKLYICPECQQIRHTPYSNKDESYPKKCQACTRLWSRLVEVLSLCYVRWGEWDQKFPSRADSSDDHLPSVTSIRNVILSFMNEQEKKVFDKYHKHLILKEYRTKPNLGQNKQLEKKPYYLKKETNDDPEWNLNLESGKQKDFIIRCLSSFMLDLDKYIIGYQKKKIENKIEEEELLLEEKKSIEDKLQTKNLEIDDLNKNITCILSNLLSNLLCPITHELPIDPVLAEDGFIYDCKAIEKHLSLRQSSPMTNNQMGIRLTKAKNITSIFESFLSMKNIDDDRLTNWKKSRDSKINGNS